MEERGLLAIFKGNPNHTEFIILCDTKRGKNSATPGSTVIFVYIIS